MSAPTPDPRQLAAALGVRFESPELLRRALTHRSFINEAPQVTADNERLEFLGDAVLDFVVADYLFERFPDMREGEMTPLRAALVKTKTLAGFAEQWGLGRFLRLGVGEQESGGRKKAANLCAAFEAVVGALYLDQGLETTRRLILALVEPALETIRAQALHIDAKSEFQEWAQARSSVTPRYELVATEGPDHAKMFTMRVLVGDEAWGEGIGRSKQKAAQAAAAEALERVRAGARP